MNKIKISTIMIFTTACLLMLAGQALAALEWTLDQTIPLTTGARDVSESPDGKRLYVLTGEGSILVLNPSGRVETTIPGPFKANRLQVNRDGSKLFLAGEGQKALQVISLNERVEIDLTGSPFKGDAAATVAVVVFSDFQWPYCARINPLLDQLVEKYPNQIKVVFKNFPLRNHKMALPAALASLAAHLQGKFWPYHDKLFSSFKTLDEEKLLQFATETDLDIKQFNRDRSSTQLSQQVNNDLRLGQTVGVRGTPTVFINGKLLQKRNIANASQLIDGELKRLNQK